VTIGLFTLTTEHRQNSCHQNAQILLDDEQIQRESIISRLSVDASHLLIQSCIFISIGVTDPLHTERIYEQADGYWSTICHVPDLSKNIFFRLSRPQTLSDLFAYTIYQGYLIPIANLRRYIFGCSFMNATRVLV
jgi:hypothetical protein